MKNNKITLKIIFLIVLMVVIESFADLLMKKGLLSIGINFIGFGNLLEFISKNIFSALIWLGLVMYLLNFLIWITALHRVELSVAFPVTSVGYIIVPIISIIFLNEQIPFLRWLGILSIVAGICFVSKSSPKEVNEPC